MDGPAIRTVLDLLIILFIWTIHNVLLCSFTVFLGLCMTSLTTPSPRSGKRQEVSISGRYIKDNIVKARGSCLLSSKFKNLRYSG